MTKSMISLTSPSNQTPQETTDASFSSCIDVVEETFVLKLTPSASTNRNPIFLRSDDKEIEVFGAEKYFSEGLSSSTHHHNKDILEIFSNKEPAQPNSRSAGQQLIRKANKKSFLATISCNCRNSVDTDNHSVHENCSNTASDQEKRSSWTCHFLKKNNCMITWDHADPSGDDNGSDSYASSDLFEIESLSKGISFSSRQGSGGSIIPGTCTVQIPEERGLNCKTRSLKNIMKLCSGGIIPGCKNQKAVSVVGYSRTS